MLQFAKTPSIARAAVVRAALRPGFSRAASAFTARSLATASAKTGSFGHPGTASKTSLHSFRSLRKYSVLTQNAAKEFKYDEVKQLAQRSASVSADVLLIDVREPVEFQEGHIPGALNVPFKSSPGAFDLTEEEFEESFGFAKPTKDQELVFYCLGGVRSTAAEELANSFGYTKRGNYIGSWEDWVTQENAAKKA